MLYKNLSNEELQSQLNAALGEYDALIKEGRNIDISRGKPCIQQLDLSNGLFNAIDELPAVGTDIRNYGGTEGLDGIRDIFAAMLGVERANVMACGNSSLNLMFDAIARAFQFGIMGETPWNKLDKVRFLCPSPGYDRHFGVTETFGVEMIAVPMRNDGPDMDIVEEYVASDPSIKGIWCVPKYSNPTGITYSDEVVKRLASMPCAGKDFRIFWDNAYCIHDLYGDKHDELLNLYKTAKEAGNEDRVYMFTSFSKVTFPGSAIAAFAASEANIKDSKKYISMQTIGPNKVNQYAHLKFLKDIDNVKAHMAKHAEIIRPKFEAIYTALDEQLGENDIACWSRPNGGYFISYDVLGGCAKKIGELCKKAGLIITPAGATYPYGIDDNDCNIRIAPTFTTAEELTAAIKILITCTKVACFTKLLESRS